MAAKTVKLRHNTDGTYTVRVERAVEHIDGHQPKATVFEAIRWAAISKGVYLADDQIVELMHNADKETRR